MAGRKRKLCPSAAKAQGGISGALQAMGAAQIPRLRHFEDEVGFELNLPGSLWYSKGAERKKSFPGKVTAYEKEHNFGGVQDHGFLFECGGTQSWVVCHMCNTAKWEWLNKTENKERKIAEMRRQAEITSKQPHVDIFRSALVLTFGWFCSKESNCSRKRGGSEIVLTRKAQSQS